MAFGLTALLGAWCLSCPDPAGAAHPSLATPAAGSSSVATNGDANPIAASAAGDDTSATDPTTGAAPTPPPAAPDAGATAAVPAPSSRLAPSSDRPWNPGRAVQAERPLESLVRIPGRVVSLPMSVVAYLMEGALLFTEEYDVVPRVNARVAQISQYGLQLGPASLGDRTGWGGRIGYASHRLHWLAASVSGSTNQYNRENVSLMFRGTGLQYQSDWRSRDPFYGVGLQTPKEAESNYASTVEALRFVTKWANKPPLPDYNDMMLPDPVAEPPVEEPGRHEVWAWVGPRSVLQSHGRDPNLNDRPSIEQRFPVLASQLGERIEHFVYGAHLGLDTRWGRPHWSHGWRLAAEAERFDVPIEALALRDAGTPSVQFTRLKYEGELGWSFYRDPRTVRLYVRVQDLRSFSHNGLFLVSDLSKLGGQEGLWGFEPGRFQDADLVLARLTYIVPLMRYLEMDLHGEAGNVYSRLEHAQLSTLEHSLGFAIRVRAMRAPIASAGIDVSREKIRLRFAIGGVE